MTTVTTEHLRQLIFFAGEASCHPDPNYALAFEKLATPGVVLELAQFLLASREKEEAESVSKTYRLSFEQWLEQQREKIDLDCGCVPTETFMHWLQVAYEADTKPIINTILEKHHLEAALMTKPGDTLGIVSTTLVHEMAKALLPLVADKIPDKADI